MVFSFIGLGVAFRVRDAQNMYLLEIDRTPAPGVKRLLRLHKGVAHVMCERQDGGYVPDTWYNIHIETSHGRLRVCVAEEGKPLDILFDLQDEYYVSSVYLAQFFVLLSTSCKSS